MKGTGGIPREAGEHIYICRVGALLSTHAHTHFGCAAACRIEIFE